MNRTLVDSSRSGQKRRLRPKAERLRLCAILNKLLSGQKSGFFQDCKETSCGLSFASTTGELDMDAGQKQDFMSFIKEDGKGFVGIHAALDTNYTWPEYGEMIGDGSISIHG
jgi:hypothetical protein